MACRRRRRALGLALLRLAEILAVAGEAMKKVAPARFGVKRCFMGETRSSNHNIPARGVKRVITLFFFQRAGLAVKEVLRNDRGGVSGPFGFAPRIARLPFSEWHLLRPPPDLLQAGALPRPGCFHPGSIVRVCHH